MSNFKLRCKDFKDCEGCPLNYPKYEWVCDRAHRDSTIAAVVISCKVDLQIYQESLHELEQQYECEQVQENQCLICNLTKEGGTVC